MLYKLVQGKQPIKVVKDKVVVNRVRRLHPPKEDKHATSNEVGLNGGGTVIG